MSVLENFKNILWSPYGGATGLKCIFFSNLQRSPWSKKKGGLSPSQRATAPVAHPRGDRGLSPVGGGDRPPLLFLQGLRCKFKEKNYI